MSEMGRKRPLQKNPVQWTEELIALTASQRRSAMDVEGYDNDGEGEEHLMESEMLEMRTREYKRRKKEIESRPLALPTQEWKPVGAKDSSKKNGEGGRSSDIDPMLKELSEEEKTLCVVGRFVQRTPCGTIDIEPEGFERLMRRQWMIDTVIDGLGTRVNVRSMQRSIHHYVLPTRFLTRLRPPQINKDSDGNVIDTVYTYDFSGVTKWTKHLDVLSLRTFLMPTNVGENHWILIILDVVKKHVIVYDPLSTESSQIKKELVRDAKRWFIDKVTSLKGSEYAEQQFQSRNWFHSYAPTYSRQKDFRSCGIFVCFALEYLTRENFNDEKHAMKITPPFKQMHAERYSERLLITIKKGL